MKELCLFRVLKRAGIGERENKTRGGLEDSGSLPPLLFPIVPRAPRLHIFLLHLCSFSRFTEGRRLLRMGEEQFCMEPREI